MKQFHKPADEKHMVAILPPGRYQEWLEAKHDIQDFMQPYDAQQLLAVAPSTSPMANLFQP
jgi:putative SOS response-associated peptidase YedK